MLACLVYKVIIWSNSNFLEAEVAQYGKRNNSYTTNNES